MKKKYKVALKIIAKLTSERLITNKLYGELERELRINDQTLCCIQGQLAKSAINNNNLRNEIKEYREDIKAEIAKK